MMSSKHMSRSKKALLFGALSALAYAAPSLPTSVAGAEWTPAAAGRQGYGEVPVWSDEFDGGMLDTTKWTRENAAWPDNDELQYYSSDEKYSKVHDGVLDITATNDATGGRAYTSARMSTKNSFTFNQGLFAARIKMTQGQGLWPAFWLFGVGELYSEFDIAECIGGDGIGSGGDDTSCSTLAHFNTKPGEYVTKQPALSHHARGKFSEAYYTFWMEWTDKAVYVGMDTDDQQTLFADVSNLKAFQDQMYIILNVAVGGNYPKDPDTTTVFPQTMSVDWVRVYAKNGAKIVTDIAPSSGTPATDPATPTNPSSEPTPDPTAPTTVDPTTPVTTTPPPTSTTPTTPSTPSAPATSTPTSNPTSPDTETNGDEESSALSTAGTSIFAMVACVAASGIATLIM